MKYIFASIQITWNHLIDRIQPRNQRILMNKKTLFRIHLITVFFHISIQRFEYTGCPGDYAVKNRDQFKAFNRDISGKNLNLPFDYCNDCKYIVLAYYGNCTNR